MRDFFFARHNYLPEIDAAAGRLAAEAALPVGRMAEGIAGRLRDRHGIRIEEAERGTLRAFDAAARVLRLSPRISPGQRAFQLATQLALLELGDQIAALAAEGDFRSAEAERLARTGIANYFAGALLMPYAPFLAAAEAESYDIDLLARRFGVGFETVCHRLSMLQKPEARGVPFFFIRTDRAGNISKRQSASDFHFSRIGGTCPLWTIYEAFARPGQILTQIPEMPDGRRHLWIARTTTRGSGGYGAPAKTFALAMGCDLRHAGRLVYARGLDLRDPAAATPIGAGCKVCERPACPQRAFPPAGRPLAADPGVSRFAPYSGG
ncbi:helix-turn-helix domain-containing protein [Amaricoccus solimangrovi]|uniref:helix-turn-helix domain-containing protein n=1 Tax=Amaricoccus solimangrovi TaxID=2589815 RepID=UPI001F207A77|nr:short-chain fatty acyl-CoA regulator family protein [Amaricoccus solimangrovi]